MVIKRIKSKFIGLLLAGSLVFCQSQTIASNSTTPSIWSAQNIYPLATLVYEYLGNKRTYLMAPNLYKNPSSLNPVTQISTALGILYAGTKYAHNNGMLSENAGLLKNIGGQILSGPELSFALAEELAKITGLEKDELVRFWVLKNHTKNIIAGALGNIMTNNLTKGFIQNACNYVAEYSSSKDCIPSNWTSYLFFKAIGGSAWLITLAVSKALSANLVDTTFNLVENTTTKTCSSAYATAKKAFNTVKNNSIVNNPVTRFHVNISKKIGGYLWKFATGCSGISKNKPKRLYHGY